MARYKLMFQDASWQDRKFFSLTKINDDGTSRIIHYVKGKSDDQITFGNYAAGHQNRQLEFTPGQTTYMGSQLGEKVASEVKIKKLLGEDIFEQLYRDNDFLDVMESMARSGNHAHIIKAAMDLRQGTCAGMLPAEYPWDFRKFVVSYYFEYLLSCKNLNVNADPDGMFTEIRAYFSAKVSCANVNDLQINTAAAATIRDQVTALLIETYPPYPVIFQYLFVGQPVSSDGLGRSIEITEPSVQQIQIIDSIFDMAARSGFFPADPQQMILLAWAANYEKLSTKAPALSSWGAGSPVLMAAPARQAGQDNLRQCDIQNRAPGI